MKSKILFLLSLTLASATIFSCKKILQDNPVSEVNGTSLTTLDDYNFVLSGTYNLFQNPNYYGSTDGSNSYVCMPDMMSDNLTVTNEDLGNYVTKSNWIYTADDSDIANTWTAAYKIIAQTNIILSGIDNLQKTKVTSINRVKGQALAIRAMVHFDIMRYWVEDFDRNSASPGIPYVTAFNYNQLPSRGTVKQDYDSIENDLRKAKIALSNTDVAVNTTNRAYMDSSVVNAILARVYLYANEMDSAVKYSTYVIKAFPLAAKTDFPNIWTDASNAEVIWSCIFSPGDDELSFNVYEPTTNRSSYAPSDSLVAMYDPKNDIRYNAYFKIIKHRLVLSKYLAKQAQLSNPDGVVNFKAFRTGEMYLIRSEAYTRLNNNAAGLNDLNTLRAARINNYTNGTETGQTLIDAIALERRKELICEGDRFFDVKRTTKNIERTNCNDFCSLTPDRREWAWPIPIGEIDANPNILPQNAGY